MSIGNVLLCVCVTAFILLCGVVSCETHAEYIARSPSRLVTGPKLRYWTLVPNIHISLLVGFVNYTSIVNCTPA